MTESPTMNRRTTADGEPGNVVDRMSPRRGKRFFACEECGALVIRLYPRTVGDWTKVVCHLCDEELDGHRGPDPDSDRGIRDGEVG